MNLKRNNMTAVEFLFKELLILDKKMSIEEILTQAKEMEKQQIENAFNNGYYQETIGYNASKEYYNKQFKNK